MAGAENGFVVFQRGKESDESDVWDDSALIKAYDNAVSIMKDRIAERDDEPGEQQGEAGEPVSTGATPEGGAKKKKKRHKPKKKKQHQWKMGDLCRAVFTEDGLLYDAEIVGVDTAAGTCTLRYTEYENEGDHLLTELLPPRAAGRSHRNSIVSESGSNDVTMMSPNAPRHRTGRATTAAAEQIPTWPTFDAQPMYPGMPFPSNWPYGPRGPSSGGPRIPSIPPPPPPQPMNDDNVSDDEALSSMLISWYMSGYHTGFYQGLQQGRHQGGGAAR